MHYTHPSQMHPFSVLLPAAVHAYVQRQGEKRAKAAGQVRSLAPSFIHECMAAGFTPEGVALLDSLPAADGARLQRLRAEHIRWHAMRRACRAVPLAPQTRQGVARYSISRWVAACICSYMVAPGARTRAVLSSPSPLQESAARARLAEAFRRLREGES